MDQDDFSASGGVERRGGVLAIGNFDGVHRGHQALIAAAIGVAQRLGLPAYALTLEPHPRALLSSPQTPFRLTPPSVKNRLLQELGINAIITMNFSPEVAGMPAREFAEDILMKHYRARHVVAGANFVFGHRRSGTMEDMRAWLEPHGIGVTAVPPVMDGSGEIISSSRLRDAIHQGDLTAARSLLGRPWSITGIVVRGEGRGRQLGFPTANVELGEVMRPPFGVYAVTARRVGATARHEGVANVGVRPTVGGVHEILEFHLFDFDDDIYDQEWEVELHHFLRPEQTFPDLETLHDQIIKDVARARELLHPQPCD